MNAEAHGDRQRPTRSSLRQVCHRLAAKLVGESFGTTRWRRNIDLMVEEGIISYSGDRDCRRLDPHAGVCCCALAQARFRCSSLSLVVRATDIDLTSASASLTCSGVRLFGTLTRSCFNASAASILVGLSWQLTGRSARVLSAIS
jgi:hypothetical protein